VPLFRRSRFTRTREGRWRVRLESGEEALLRGLPDQLQGLLAGNGGESTVRLFPPAYAQDAEMDAEYQRLMRDELVRRRLEAVATVRESLGHDELTDDELHAWARVLNDVRLVLGTVLDVSEDSDVLDVAPGAPDTGQRVLYVVLSAIVDDAVGALSGALPPPTVVD
jgi:hypothetical protein